MEYYNRKGKAITEILAALPICLPPVVDLFGRTRFERAYTRSVDEVTVIYTVLFIFNFIIAREETTTELFQNLHFRSNRNLHYAI